MTKLIHFLGQKLSTQLVMVVVIAMALAYVSFPLFMRLSYSIIESTVASPETISQDEARYIWMLQEFIIDNNISIDDLTHINNWVASDKNIKLTLFTNNLIFDSDYESRIYSDASLLADDEKTSTRYHQYLDKQYISTLIKDYNSNLYTLTFADGTIVNALVHSESYSIYYLWAYYACLSLSIMIFILICLMIVRLKLRYLRTLSRELKILESGDLTYEMTEAGHDELYELAEGINQLRLSLIAKKQEEEKTKEAHQKLMTALAHDLRTPLTSLIGYLELLLLKRYQDEEQLRHFLISTKRKAFQIREMSDKLFEYFLATERTAETYHKEVIKTHLLVESLIDNQLFDLESSGFPIKLYADLEVFKGQCLIDPEFLQRVLDNTLSNIRKYANREKPLDVLAFETDTFLHIEFVNALNPNVYSVESTALGLRTCIKIMQEHGGSYQGYEQGDRYVSRLILPLFKE
ncbi:MAG: HAMP domain-containing histidine kinase [Lachnospiraceae bacterium]|nr:HAMP domain-containing histidine kinase [Lachnospiraceae bacterium]